MGIRVLLADDHAMVRQALRGLVEKDQGITVVAEAKDGVEVLALAREFAPDIVIMDVGMPGMDGIEATQRLLAGQCGSRWSPCLRMRTSVSSWACWRPGPSAM